MLCKGKERDIGDKPSRSAKSPKMGNLMVYICIKNGGYSSVFSQMGFFKISLTH